MDDLTSPAVLTARSPEDLIAMVPVVLGFVPAESLVMLTFGGRAFHARVDLPRGPCETRAATEALMPPVRRSRIEAVAFVAYAADDRVARRAVRALRKECRAAGVAVVDALRVHEGRWHPLRGEAPAGGVPFDVSAHPFVAEAVVLGRIVHGSREELAATITPDPDAVAAVEQAPPQPPASPLWVSSVVARHVADRTTPAPAVAARLLAALADPVCRDAAWLRMRRETAREEVELWTDLVRRCPHPLTGHAAAVLAFAAWVAGDGALAWCAIDRSLDASPGHTLAVLVGDLIASATPPHQWEVVRTRLRESRSA